MQKKVDNIITQDTPGCVAYNWVNTNCFLLSDFLRKKVRVGATVGFCISGDTRILKSNEDTLIVSEEFDIFDEYDEVGLLLSFKM